MPFTIQVFHDQKTYRCLVEHVPVDGRTGHLKLIAGSSTLLWKVTGPLPQPRPFFPSTLAVK